MTSSVGHGYKKENQIQHTPKHKVHPGKPTVAWLAKNPPIMYET